MAELTNHPGHWMRDDAAEAFDRAERDHGTFKVTSAGRTVAEQQQLIDRWFAGGVYNRPPYLYDPARPPETSAHVKDGGIAVDVSDWQRFLAVAGDYGFVQTFDWDVVHFEYRSGSGAGGGQTEEDEIMAAADDITWIKERIGGSIKGGGSVTEDIRMLRRKVDEQQKDIDWIKDRIGGTSSTPSLTDYARGTD